MAFNSDQNTPDPSLLAIITFSLDRKRYDPNKAKKMHTQKVSSNINIIITMLV